MISMLTVYWSIQTTTPAGVELLGLLALPYAAVEALMLQLHVAPKLLRHDNNGVDIMLCCA